MAREKEGRNRISERCSYLMGTKLPSTMEEANEMKRSRGDKLERKPVYTVYTNDRLLECCASEEIEESFVLLYSPSSSHLCTLRYFILIEEYPNYNTNKFVLQTTVIFKKKMYKILRATFSCFLS